MGLPNSVFILVGVKTLYGILELINQFATALGAVKPWDSSIIYDDFYFFIPFFFH